MASTAVESGPRLIAFVLPSIPESVPVARFHVRAALGFHGLDDYANDIETITSELVPTRSARPRRRHRDDRNNTRSSGSPAAVTFIVSDSSPEGPIRRDTPADSEQGRGLQIVEALSAHWGWRQQDGGKAIFATLAREA